MSRLTRDGTAEPVSRDQILRHARGQGNIHFPCSADHEQDWQPYPVGPYSVICDDHTYIHMYSKCFCFVFVWCPCMAIYVVVVVVSHIQRIGCQPENKKLLYTVANPARGLPNREKNKNKKSDSAPPHPPARAARSEKIRTK